MGNPPVLVAEAESAWNTATSPKTVSVTTSADDVLIVTAVAADAATDFGTPIGNSLTYEMILNSGNPNNCRVNTWGAIASGAATFNVSLAKTGGTDNWGFVVFQFSGSLGYYSTGSSQQTAQGTGAPTTNLTTTADNTALVAVVGDWNGADGTTRTWRTVNGITPTVGNGLERAYFRAAGVYTVYAAYWDDVGTAGLVTPGLSAPSGQEFTLAAVPVYGDTAPDTPGGSRMSPSAKQMNWQQSY